MKALAQIIAILLLFINAVSAQSWNALGQGLNNTVDKIVLYGADDPDDDDLYVCGHFTNAGGIEDADHIALWDGTQWHAVAPGLNSTVNAIAFNNDNIYAGGSFTNAGGNPNANYIAFWDGIQWNALGEGFNHRVLALAFDGSNLYAGGFFTSTEGHTNYIARWDGLQWHSLGEGLNQPVNAIVVKGQDVFAGGWFTNAGGDDNADYIARWDGHKWNAMGNGINDPVISITLNGDELYVGGSSNNNIAKWNGIEWSYLPVDADILSTGISDIAVIDQELYVAGFLSGVLHWDGSQWNTLPDWIGPKTAITVALKGNNLYVGGEFELTPQHTNNIALWGTPDLTGKDEPPDHAACKLNVFPNPALDILHFTLEDDGGRKHSVKILDLTGRMIMNTSTETYELNISQLPASVYFLQVNNNGKWLCSKFVKD